MIKLCERVNRYQTTSRCDKNRWQTVWKYFNINSKWHWNRFMWLFLFSSSCYFIFFCSLVCWPYKHANINTHWYQLTFEIENKSLNLSNCSCTLACTLECQFSLTSISTCQTYLGNILYSIKTDFFSLLLLFALNLFITLTCRLVWSASADRLQTVFKMWIVLYLLVFVFLSSLAYIFGFNTLFTNCQGLWFKIWQWNIYYAIHVRG